MSFFRSFMNKRDRKSALPILLVVKTEVVAVIVLSYFSHDWLKESCNLRESFCEYFGYGIWIVAGVTIINLYIYLFKKIFHSIKDN